MKKRIFITISVVLIIFAAAAYEAWRLGYSPSTFTFENKINVNNSATNVQNTAENNSLANQIQPAVPGNYRDDISGIEFSYPAGWLKAAQTSQGSSSLYVMFANSAKSPETELSVFYNFGVGLEGEEFIQTEKAVKICGQTADEDIFLYGAEKIYGIKFSQSGQDYYLHFSANKDKWDEFSKIFNEEILPSFKCAK